MSLNLTLAKNTIAALHLDALIFADHLSEGTSNALTFMRLAPIQALFWGNPVTSGALTTLNCRSIAAAPQRQVCYNSLHA